MFHGLTLRIIYTNSFIESADPYIPVFILWDSFDFISQELAVLFIEKIFFLGYQVVNLQSVVTANPYVSLVVFKETIDNWTISLRSVMDESAFFAYKNIDPHFIIHISKP